MNNHSKIFVVDDDEAVRDALTMLFEAAGHHVEVFPDATSFLDACPQESEGCAILDVNMPGMDGPMLQQKLLQRGVRLPLIFLTGYGSIPTSVRTIKSGAMDFLIKPVKGSVLLESVRLAIQHSQEIKQQARITQTARSRLTTLSEREREVMTLAIAGKSNKEIAQHLAISYRTVETHRAHVIQKTGVTNLLELASLVALTDAGPH